MPDTASPVCYLHSMREFSAIVLLLLVGGCSDDGSQRARSESGGTVVISASQDPGTLFPPFVETPSAKQITEQFYDYLADVGPSLETRNESDFRRELADS
jgi:hypothetical protein